MRKEKRLEKKRAKQLEKKSFRKALQTELREHKSSFIVFCILRTLVLVVLVRQVMLRSYESVFFCALTLLLLYIPSWVQVKLRIELPPPLEITILCFIFAAEILGEVNAFYVVVPNWDTMLHTINGFLAAAVGFSMVMLLNDDERLTFHLSPLFLALVAFCFSMTIGVLWEFFEFSMDYFLGTDMQKDTIVHALHTVALDTTRSNKVVTIPNIQEVYINGEPLGLGLSGHRHHRHHEGPVRELHRRGGVLRHRLLLRPQPGPPEDPGPELRASEEEPGARLPGPGQGGTAGGSQGPGGGRPGRGGDPAPGGKTRPIVNQEYNKPRTSRFGACLLLFGDQSSISRSALRMVPSVRISYSYSVLPTRNSIS